MRRFSKAEIEQACVRADLHPAERSRLLLALESGPQEQGAFEPAHVSYYFGALLIIGAMGWFITQAWDRLPGLALTAIALLYAGVFSGAAVVLSRRPNSLVPAGVLMTVAVCMTPLAVYGVERQLHWWPLSDPGGYARFHPYINASWVLMEACTVLVSALALRLVRFPFVTAPAAYALWYASMDVPRLIGVSLSFRQEADVTVGFGLAMLLVGFLADGESDLDLSFWLYLFGLLCFSGGMIALGEGKQVGTLLFGGIHFALIVISLVLQRRVFLVFGGLGVFTFLAVEASRFFKTSFTFTVALTALGILFLVMGFMYKRHEAALVATLEAWTPQWVRRRQRFRRRASGVMA